MKVVVLDCTHAGTATVLNTMKKDGDAEKVEEHVGGGGLFRVAVGPEGGQHGRDGGADIVP